MMKNSSNLLKKITPVVSGAILLLSSASCSDDVQTFSNSISPSPSLTIYIPSVPEYNTRAQVAANEDEKTIHTLNLYLFDESGKLVDQPIDLTTLSKRNGTGAYAGYDSYTLENITPGSYQAILTANVEKYWTEPSDKNKTDIENALLSFSNDKKLEKEWLPMACLSTAIIEANQTTGVFSLDNNNTTITAPLSFLCAKVRYTILFDATENGISKDFGNNIPDLKEDPFISNLIQDTQIKLGEPRNNLIENGKWNFNLIKYDYPGENYPDIDNNGNPDGDLTLSDNAVTNQFAWQGTIYIPENLSQNTSLLNVTLSQGDSESSKIFDIHPTGNSDNSKSVKRGYMYDITTVIKNPWNSETTITENNWDLMYLPSDLVHTYLSIDKTEASVTSIFDDVINYSTDGRGALGFECVNPDNFKDQNGNKIETPLIILGAVDSENQQITISANSAININDLASEALIGEASCYIIAGNIRKKIIVNYNLQAFFEVSPSSLTFNLADARNGSLGSQQFSFETNLGGIKIYKSNETGIKGEEITANIVNGGYNDEVSLVYVNEKGTQSETSHINVSCPQTDVSSGNITVQVVGESSISHVAHHYLYVEPLQSFEGKDFGMLLMVSIIPDQGDYRVYFRAINDYQDEINKQLAGEFLNGNWDNFPAEDYTRNFSASESSNWIDWWDYWDYKDDEKETKNHPANPSNNISNFHFIYVYGQIGETGNDFNDPTSWAYNNFDYDTNDDQVKRIMDGDFNHPGWYFKDLRSNLTANGHIITPGQTLMIFHNRSNASAVHRCSHHNDPGVPLFNYEDREGWYLYDPSREPYYTVYDDKPAIEDVVYEIYTKDKPGQWFRNYGVATGNSSYDTHTTYKMYGNLYSSSIKELGKTIKSGDYYVTQLKFKAPQGDYAKNIYLYTFPDGVAPTRVYIDCNDNKVFHNDQYAPFCHIWKEGQPEYREYYSEDERMTRVSGTNYFYYDIPENYVGGKVIIMDAWKNNAYPGPGGYDIQEGHWKKYSDNFDYQWTEFYQEDILDKIKLFNHENYPVSETNGNVKIIKGYYDGSKWHQGAPY